ncbi:MAG: TetR/AcrR family transcriptional regulator [Gemmatimonadaceae bacterium]|nr:TetR/AcrR family transcriptional regulator [Gemmatimonadaceae bacterium]
MMTPARRTAESTARLRASLIDCAQRLVARDGARALTMRALAAEAGCALGLPYKVFASREELIAELIRIEYARLRDAFAKVIASAGTGTVGGNLGRYAEALLASPAVSLAPELHSDEALRKAVDEEAVEAGLVGAVESTVVQYLAAEKRLGRVAPDVDERAFGFLIAGAVHNLLHAGTAYPNPGIGAVKRMLGAIAVRLAPPQRKEKSHGRK